MYSIWVKLKNIYYMLEIKNLRDTKHADCVQLLEKMLKKNGKIPVDFQKEIQWWTVRSEDRNVSLLNDPVLSTDEEGNELEAIFFISRRKNAQHLKLFGFESVVGSHKKKKELTIAYAIERFIEEMPEYIPPMMVVLLGKISEEGKLYTGGFLYNIPPYEKDICKQRNLRRKCILRR